mmetsp:Transcript_30229/g.71230  ORF Transcript_30229/g.71230 Transcript_30229/m.71230 type:complete len:225 (-) Transcript_30229:453-1127(-)
MIVLVLVLMLMLVVWTFAGRGGARGGNRFRGERHHSVPPAADRIAAGRSASGSLVRTSPGAAACRRRRRRRRCHGRSRCRSALVRYNGRAAVAVAVNAAVAAVRWGFVVRRKPRSRHLASESLLPRSLLRHLGICIATAVAIAIAIRIAIIHSHTGIGPDARSGGCGGSGPEASGRVHRAIVPGSAVETGAGLDGLVGIGPVASGTRQAFLYLAVHHDGFCALM